MSGGGQSWEFSKENIQPIRGGRSVATIDEALHSSADVLRSERQQFEDEIRKSDDCTDPLDVWYRYYKWFEEHYPSGKETQLRKLLEQCLKTCTSDSRYKNDERLLKIWLKYVRFYSE
uniref:BUB1 N-terminal domain-containing protein n=1 Tax=Plectus sambesii TaxID=2011161 RepID=A0A914X8W2_9BILA